MKQHTEDAQKKKKEVYFFYFHSIFKLICELFSDSGTMLLLPICTDLIIMSADVQTVKGQ